MTTRTFGPGRQTLAITVDTSANDVFDAATNNSFFIADWQSWIAGDTSTTNAYPVRFDQANGFFTWNGGRFYGNVPEDAPWQGPGGFYNQSAQRMNSAVWFPSGGVSGVIRNAEFGIRDNLDSGFIDGLRTVQAGNITVEDCKFWLSRDDCIEADGGGNLTVRRCFFENVYSWISCTAAQPSKIITVEDTICRFRRWRFEGTDFRIAPVFKSQGIANVVTWRMTNVTLAIPPSWVEVDYNRTRGALSRMNCTNCTLLVYGGTLTNANGLRDAFLAAGWNIIEDGSGVAASEAWDAAKAAFLGEDEPVTPPGPLTGLTVNITVV